jgi:hypothetical protein
MHGEGVHDQKVGFFILIDLTRMIVFLYEVLFTHQAPARQSLVQRRLFGRCPAASTGPLQEISRRGRQIGPDGESSMISKINVHGSWRRNQRSAREDVVVSVKYPDRYAAIRRTRATERPLLLLQRTRDQFEQGRPFRAAGSSLREPTFAAGIRNSKSCTECRGKGSILWLGNSVSPLTQASSGEPLAVIPSSAHGERAQDPRSAPDDDACGLPSQFLAESGKSRVGGWRPSEPGDFALDLKLKRRTSNRDSVGPC